MTLRNDAQLANTEEKFADLQKLISQAQSQAGQGRSTEVRSLTRLANELREEIARYKASTRRAASRH